MSAQHSSVGPGLRDIDTDSLLTKAIEEALANGKGWKEGEKEEYLKRITDDDNLPPLFATCQEDLDKSGLAEAFSSLLYEDETPSSLMLSFKQKGNDAFVKGNKNVAKNMQYYRDAINHYYEAISWAEKVKAVEPGFIPDPGQETDEKYFSEDELSKMKSTLYANAAMAHMQLKNWGYVRDDSKKALDLNMNNVKACYRLAKAYQMLKDWEGAGDAIDAGLSIEGEAGNKDLKKLQTGLAHRVRKARLARQKRERLRAERVASIKKVWKWCRESKIKLGRVPLVSSVTDDEEEDQAQEHRWHHHHPHTGKLPHTICGDWVWPCMFIYPSHQQSDFIEHFSEGDMFALRMAQLFPELEDGTDKTSIPWDYNNEFTCSKLAVYFEVHCTPHDEAELIHPEYVEPLNDQASTIRFHEASRALKGDEGPDIATVAECVERRHLHRQRKAWKAKHGSLWAKPQPCSIVRVHPAATLRDVLVDTRMVVPAFLPTFVLFPEDHPVHSSFLKEHECVGIIEPKGQEAQ